MILMLFKIAFVLSLFGALSMGMLSKASAYRILSVITISLLVTEITVEYGWLGFIIVAVTIGMVIPAAVLVMARSVVWITWHSIRKQFPDEVTSPPCNQLSLVDVYRFMWLS